MNGSAIREAVLWGATGQARVVREILSHANIGVAALVDNDGNLGSPFEGAPILHGEVSLDAWLAKRKSEGPLGFCVAIGGEHGRDRLMIQKRLQARGLVALDVRHPTAVVLTDSIGAGAQILASATVCVDARLGAAVIVNTGASVDHECEVGDGVHVQPGARLAGCVIVERFATIGTGAVVLPRIHIGEGAVVGAGAVVLEDVAPFTVVVGNPARTIGSRARPQE